MFDGESSLVGGVVRKLQVIGVNIDQRHTAFLREPSEFLEPDGGAFFAEKQVKG